MKKISIISPVYDNVGNLSKRIAEFDEIFKDRYDYQVLCYYRAQLPGSLMNDKRFVYYRIEDGQGFDDCVTDGFEKADGEAVILADLNNDNCVEYLQNLLMEWENRAEIVLTKKQDDRKFNFFQKIGKFFVNLFNKFQNWVLNMAGLTKDFGAERTFQLFDRNSSDLIKEFPERNYYLRNFNNWSDYRVAVLKTKENLKVVRHDKVWTTDLILSVVSFGVTFALILALAISTNKIAAANRAMYILIGIGLIIVTLLFGLRNLFFWFVYRKARIKREKAVVENEQQDVQEKPEAKQPEKAKLNENNKIKININKK